MSIASLKIVINEKELEDHININLKQYFNKSFSYIYKYNEKLKQVEINVKGLNEHVQAFNKRSSINEIDIETDLERILYGEFLKSNLDCHVEVQESSLINSNSYSIDLLINWSVNYPG